MEMVLFPRVGLSEGEELDVKKAIGELEEVLKSISEAIKSRDAVYLRFAFSLRGEYAAKRERLARLVKDESALAPYDSEFKSLAIRWKKTATRLSKTGAANASQDVGIGKQLAEHRKRCEWMFAGLEAWRVQQRDQLNEVRVAKEPFLKPPTVGWLTQYINVEVFRLPFDERTKKCGTVCRDGKKVVPVSERQIGRSLELALGATINDIKRIYADWKERSVKEVAQDKLARKNDDDCAGSVDVRLSSGEVDLAGGEHNWAGIAQSDNDYAPVQTSFKLAARPSKWMKTSSRSYQAFQSQIKDKPGYFDYRIFMYWIGLRLKGFVRMRSEVRFKPLLGTVQHIEDLFAALERFENDTSSKRV